MKCLTTLFTQFSIFILIIVTTACTGAVQASGTNTPAATLQPLDSKRSLSVNGLERSYLIHIPSGLTVGQPAALVIVFHGYSETASLIQQNSGFNVISDKAGFIVVYPNGSGTDSGQSWNAVGCCGYAIENNVDDKAFVRQIISEMGKLARIDSKRVYATGFSNGALLSYRLACEMPDTLAAIAPVAGVLVSGACQPAQAVSVIDFHGLVDNVVPYNAGGTLLNSGKPFPPVDESIVTWSKLDGCNPTPQTEQSPAYTLTSYSGCLSGSSVELYAVNGIGHSWPSQYIIPASQMIWDFFKSHPKP